MNNWSTQSAEIGILSGLITGKKELWPICDKFGITSETFVSSSYKTLFNELCKRNEDGDSFDYLTIATRFAESEPDIQVALVDALDNQHSSSIPLVFASYCEAISQYRTKQHNRRISDLIKEIVESGGDPTEAARTLRTFGEINASSDLSKRYTFKELLGYPYKEDPSSMLGNRWLCKASQCLWLGPSGVGKSTLCFQAAMYWALGLPFFGIKPARPLRSLIIQAEDDLGDCSEFFNGMFDGLQKVERLTMAPEEMTRLLKENFIVIRNTISRGQEFAKFAKKNIKELQADMVWINPLFSYAGCSVSDQAEMSTFLRDYLTPVAEETGVIWHVIHHVPKPSTDSKARNHWSDSDFAYMGFGSSEITNWARAINYIEPTKDGPFKLRLAKRGNRAGAIPDPSNANDRGNTIYLDHHDEFVFWLQVPPPAEEIEKRRKKQAKQASDLVGVLWPASYSEIVGYVMAQFKSGKQSAEKRVTRWINDKSICKNSNDLYLPSK